MNILKIPSRSYGNPQAEATLQRQRGLVLPNAAVFTNPGWVPGAFGPRLLAARELSHLL